MTDSFCRSPEGHGADRTEEAREIPAGVRAEGRITPPSSKSFSHRYLTLAFLSGAPLTVEQPLDAEDIDLFFRALAAAGFQVRHSGDGGGHAQASIQPGTPPPAATLYCGNAGTMARFLTAAATAVPGEWTVDGTPRLRERPVGPLVDAVRQLGGEVEYRGREGFLPVRLGGGSLRGGFARLDAGESSQYLSALLMAALAAPEPTELEVAALTSEPYVVITRRVIEAFGGRVEEVKNGRLRIEPGIEPPGRVRVEADYSAACYPAAAAALSGGDVHLVGLATDSPQGDRAFFALLEKMGAQLEAFVGQSGTLVSRGWRVSGSGALTAVEADLSSMPDQVPTLAALAPFARGVTRITGVPHLRIKESDRLAAMARELARVGAEVEEKEDGLVIPGVWAEAEPPTEAVTTHSYDDHRIAMAMALVGLRRPGIRVGEPGVVAKSYPGFWEDLDVLTGRAKQEG